MEEVARLGRGSCPIHTNMVLYGQNRQLLIKGLFHNMIRIGKLTDYAMLILSTLAKEPDMLMSATRLAEILHLSVPTISKVLKMLSDASLVNSKRGAEGGYRLAKPAQAITLAHVIEAMEGEVAMTECAQSVSHCAIDTKCTQRNNWRKINKMVQTLLGRFTIVDMLTPLSHRDL